MLPKYSQYSGSNPTILNGRLSVDILDCSWQQYRLKPKILEPKLDWQTGQMMFAQWAIVLDYPTSSQITHSQHPRYLPPQMLRKKTANRRQIHSQNQRISPLECPYFGDAEPFQGACSLTLILPPLWRSTFDRPTTARCSKIENEQHYRRVLPIHLVWTRWPYRSLEHFVDH